MITPPSIWKRSHNHHHNNNSKLFSASIGSFPIMTKQKFIEALVQEQDKVSKSMKIISGLTSQMLSELNPSNEKFSPSSNFVLHLRQKRSGLDE